MEIHSLIDLTKYVTFRMAPPARYFGVVKNMEDLKYGFEFAEEKNLPVIILGSGSNMIIAKEEVLEAVVLKIEISGFDVTGENEQSVVIKVGAGEIWDDVVERTVKMGLSGIEAMSWIPGTVGATPVQNVGAYGKEISDVLVSLEAYEIDTGLTIKFTKEQCEFGYRDSVFKSSAASKYVITSITIKLSKTPEAIPDYPGVKKYFEDLGILKPALSEIREAIISIRNFKLPNPKVVASVGSFFKNPIVPKEQGDQIKEKYPNVVIFPLLDGKYKIGAGWLLENLGLKGKLFGNLKFYENNSLVLVNNGSATYSELESLVEQTKHKVKVEYGVDLEMEPVIIG